MKVQELIKKIDDEIELFIVNEAGEEYSNHEGWELHEQLQAFTAFLGSWGLLEEEIPLVDIE